MGVKQSKRSVDITEISTKGEIEGFGNEGKVEKIIDGVVDKVAVNGHVDGELQNGVEAHQNGLEPIQNGEAAAVATEKVTEKKEIDDSPVEGGVVNGQVENGEMHAEAEKTDEQKKSEDKKEKRKEKKEKVVKKKFSFRNFSFSKKDKSKPPKEEKSPEKVDEAGIEETPTSPEKEELASPSEGQLVDSPKPQEPTKPEPDTTAADLTTTTTTTTIPEQPEREVELPAEVTPQPPAPVDDLPPPLPASPPPSESIDTKIVADLKEIDSSESAIVDNSSGEINEVASSLSNLSPVQVESPTEPDPEQIVFQAGKQIEEKATNLLRTVEERAGESLRTAGDLLSQNLPVGGALGEVPDAQEEVALAKNAQEPISTIPVDIANLGSLSPKGEEASDKAEEGAGESLADIPKDLREEVTAATIEASNPPDSPEVAATVPPPVVEAVTGE